MEVALDLDENLYHEPVIVTVTVTEESEEEPGEQEPGAEEPGEQEPGEAPNEEEAPGLQPEA